MRLTKYKSGIVLFLISFLFISGSSAQETVGLDVGIKAPNFKAVIHKGDEIEFSKYYEGGPVVLLFYRGGWCRYCNIQLQEYQSKIEEFSKLGVSILAISVDKQEKVDEMVKDKDFSFDVISNPKANLLKKYNVTFKVPEELAETYLAKYKVDLKAASGRDDYLIAVPATYIVDTDGKIIYAYANEDYTKRPSTQVILDVLKSL